MVSLKKKRSIREMHPAYSSISYEEQLKKEYAHLQKNTNTSARTNPQYREMKPQYVNKEYQAENKYKNASTFKNQSILNCNFDKEIEQNIQFIKWFEEKERKREEQELKCKLEILEMEYQNRLDYRYKYTPLSRKEEKEFDEKDREYFKLKGVEYIKYKKNARQICDTVLNRYFFPIIGISLISALIFFIVDVFGIVFLIGAIGIYAWYLICR